MSGTATRARNYCSVHLGDNSDQLRFYVERFDNRATYGKWFNDDEAEGAEAAIPTKELSHFEFRIIQHFKELNIEYKSGLEFIVHQVLCVPLLKTLSERLQQKLFNKRTLFRSDRVEVLRYTLSQMLTDHNHRTSAIGLLRAFHGMRGFRHPKGSELITYYDFVLKSLAESGDLRDRSGSYELAPKGLSTIVEHEEDDRRHRDLVRQQKALKYLTAALVFIGILQVSDKLSNALQIVIQFR